MIELTQGQCEQLVASTESPLTVIDPETKAAYVLVPQELYERLRGIVEDDDARLMAPLLADLDPEDWEDASVYEEKP